MYARVSTFEGVADHIDEEVRVAREEFIPAAQKSGGFEGMYVLVDHESGRSVTVTFWSSREAMQASEEKANHDREEAAHDAGGAVAKVERYEVVLSPPGPVSGVTDTVGDTVGGVTGTVGGATDSVRGVTDNLLGGEEKQR